MNPKDFVMPWGKYKGKTLEEIASLKKGLVYLDWILGELEMDLKVGSIKGPNNLKVALETYLAEPSIQKELDRVLEDEDE